MNAVFENIACMLNCMRLSLNIFDVDKWVVFGNLIFKENDHTFDCKKEYKEGKAIPRDMKNVEIVHSKASFILLVEKDAIFFFFGHGKNYITIFHA